ncbi:alanine racemase [soil metagenome]
MTRPTWAEVDLEAVAHNVAELARIAAPAQVCAVVKADGYGHGAVPVARAALAAGATWLGVAMVEEGVELRRAGIDAPVLVLSEPDPTGVADVVAHRLRPTVYRRSTIDALADAADTAGAAEPVPVHLKVDTGMHRVGAPSDELVGLAAAVRERSQLVLEGVSTHCAVADQPGHGFTAIQIDRFDAALAALDGAGLRPPIVHAANSAAAIDHPRSRHDLVRCGITVYGIAPAAALAGRADLRPALRLRSAASLLRAVPAGDGISYGLRHTFSRDSVVATVPVGYADGMPRRLGTTGGEVLVGGRRCPIAGTVTMDQITVDVTDAGPVAVGDEVVLIGAQGDERITADEWAERLGTIAYEIVCGIGPRVPRHY